ncbi:Tetratricopeptide repeat (TPR)-like superfamily protein [Striga hermonthica]|uniref:Tetratricopeptide repeat (TPR)-like superfamily protein n=1 Tax=Striga hermonthica TaxID=68872 RepID=A0A9N7MWV8_STRHE|nr:Tetratricopeptide repeat (TPR)-like superfamily protein [Striga hermonthica]
MAVSIGNISPLLDLATRTILPDRTRALVPDRRATSLLPSDAVLSLFWKDTIQPHYPDSTFDHRERHTNRGSKSSRSKSSGVEYENSSDDENGSGIEDELGEDEGFDWEKEMRRRVKEIEEMRELETKAEELQYRVDQDFGDGGGGDDGDGGRKEENEEEKRMRVKKELEKVAMEQAERRKTAQLMFDLGQRAYEKGTYARATEFFEAALTIIPRPTLFGGEIQIWLAMAYEANNRHADCIDLYQQLEKKHPSVSIRRQASELRYILQAPKLKITQEEMVTIPLIGSSYDSYAATWTDKYKDKDQRMSGSTTNQLPSNKDYLADFLVWKPPVGLEKNQAFWVSLTLWVGLVGAALFLQR